MRQLILILCLVLASGVVQAQKVYKVIQPDGTVLFTDSPPPDEPAREVEILPLNTAPPLVPQSAYTKSAAAAPEAAYSEFRITSPANDASFWDTAGDVNVNLSLKPTLRGGDKIDLLLNGQFVGGGKATAITLTEMERGTHNLQALVKDSAGKVVARSNTVTFTLQRGSKLSPQRRPRPTPF